MLKKEVRANLLAKRQQLALEEVVALSRKIQANLLAHPRWQNARSVALYVASPSRGEVRTDDLLDHAWMTQKRVFLPRCLPSIPGDPTSAGRMDFVACSSWDDLGKGCFFGILEPKPRCRQIAGSLQFPSLPDLMIIPVVGLRLDGARLGYGGGYYDRILARSDWKRVPRIALAYSFQICSKEEAWSESDPHDIPIASCVTENGVIQLAGTGC